MRRLTLLLILLTTALGLWAQSGADRIVGTYKAVFSNNDAKIRVFRHNGGYRMQICWLREPKNPDGTLKTDLKNPDPKKRKTPMSQVVLVDHVTYEDGIWENGRIYDPKGGRTYRVELSLEGKKLEVKAKLGPFHKCMYWTKID